MKKRRFQTVRKRQSSQKKGMPPGNLIYIGDEKSFSPTIQVIDYGAEHFEEKTFTRAEDCFKYRDSPSSTWINVDGIHHTGLVESIGQHFGINALALEDVVNTNSRPKIDDYTDYVFIILKMLSYDKEKHSLVIEQVSLVLGKNFVISFQEDPGDLFDGIRARLRLSDSRSRKMSSDYLTYLLMDRIVDEYFLIIEDMGEELEEMEEAVALKPDQGFIQRFNALKRDSIFLRKSVWPLREVINQVLRNEVALIHPEVLPYFRDLYDHTIQVIDTTETYRDLFSDIMDLYLSNLSLRLNEVMKVLTVISTTFIPLTFIAGVYGMNFDVMPELHWPNGYFIIWGIMIAVAGGLIYFFRRRNWF